MAYEFVGMDRDQQLLMPPSVAEWVPEDHPVRFVVEVVDVLDLSVLVAKHPLGGAGRRAYHPAMMVGLLMWAYANGVFSSREIERRCVSDVAFRFVTANQVPDHGTIARFRSGQAAELKELHTQVLSLLAQLGLVSLGLVALDGTKVAANASKDANRTAERLEEMVQEWFDKAQSRDDAENRLFGDERGDEVPADLRRAADRAERIRQAARRARERQAQREHSPRSDPADTGTDTTGTGTTEAAADVGEEVVGCGGGVEADNEVGSPPDAPGGTGGGSGRGRRTPVGNVTDPQSGLMPVRGGGFVQGYNAQTVAGRGGIVLASRVVDTPADVTQFQPMVIQLRATLTEAGINARVGTVVADAGYWSAANATVDLEVGEVLIATDQSMAKTTAKAAEGLPDPMLDPGPDPDQVRYKQRLDVMQRWDAGHIDYRQAGTELGLSQSRTYELRSAYQARGPEGLRPERAAFGHARPAAKEPTNSQIAKHAMRAKLVSPEGRATYKQRAHTIEGVFGNTKHNYGFRRFSRRGLAAVDAEWTLVHTVTNLDKLRRGIDNLAWILAGRRLKTT